MTTLFQPSPTLCTESEVRQLVEAFYDRVRADDLLGPVFAAHVHDWPQHLEHLTNFWSSLLRGTRQFDGAPMAKHLAIKGLNWGLFQRWLQLFSATTAQMGNVGMQTLADASAARIAENFWRRYQMAQWPSLPPVLGSV